MTYIKVQLPPYPLNGLHHFGYNNLLQARSWWQWVLLVSVVQFSHFLQEWFNSATLEGFSSIYSFFKFHLVGLNGDFETSFLSASRRWTCLCALDRYNAPESMNADGWTFTPTGHWGPKVANGSPHHHFTSAMFACWYLLLHRQFGKFPLLFNQSKNLFFFILAGEKIWLCSYE